MNYSEVKTLALGYADREDAEVIDNMDNFMRVVEAKINRKLKTRKMSVRSRVPTVADQEYYGLPADFAGVRDIEIQAADGTGKRTTLYYLTPEQMNQQVAASIGVGSSEPKIYYTIIADQFQIYPPQDGRILEIVYYRNVPPLTAAAPNNWLSDYSPDCYTFGLLVEISAFTKDKDSTASWEARFTNVVAELELDDVDERWSGTPLQIRRA